MNLQKLVSKIHIVEEYISVIDKIKKRYGTLILKGNILDENVKGNLGNTNANSTTIYDNNEDEEEAENIFEKIEDEELGFNKMSENDRNEMKQLRSNLRELCDNINSIIVSDSFNISDDHKKELRDFIDDTLLWIHIHKTPTKNDYKCKIDEINDACNKIMEEYQKENKEIFQINEISKSITSKKDELEQLCLTIKSSIDCNIFSIDEHLIKLLDDSVSTTLDWIIEERNEEQYIDKLDEINKLCDKLYQSMMGIMTNNDKTILGNDLNNNHDDFFTGTKLSDLK